MTVATFLDDLRARGVTLRAEGDALNLRAPKGALTEADRDRLRREKAAILAWLQSPADDSEPFPLTDIQQAYLVGRVAELELGRVGCPCLSRVRAERCRPASAAASLEPRCRPASDVARGVHRGRPPAGP